MDIKITDIAANMILETANELEEDFYLSLYVTGGGCSGLKYGLGLETGEPYIDDIIVESKGIKVVVDQKSAKLLDGIIIDYVQEGLQAGFKIENPNASKTCGCGSSFSSDEDYEFGGCNTGCKGCGK
jgi:iron-sulfur cluster assembly protein